MSIEQPMSFLIDEELDGQRLSYAVTRSVQGLSARAVKRLIERGRVFLDERRTLKASLTVRKGEQVEVFSDRIERSVSLGPESVIIRTPAFIVVNKPPGLPVYGSRGISGETLVPLLEELARRAEGVSKKNTCSTSSNPPLQLVHRLDRDTSGLLLVARNDEVLRFFENQFLQRVVKKRYRVLVRGSPPRERFRRESVVRPKQLPGGERVHAGCDQRARKGQVRRSREAVTEFHVREWFAGGALVDASPLTGHTHQIRIHLAQLGLPVLGDTLYGSQRCPTPLSRAVPRQMLHAANLTFRNPDDGKSLALHAPLPDDMEAVLRRLRSGEPV